MQGLFLDLPKDVLRLIVKELHPRDTLTLRLTCSWMDTFVTYHCNRYWFFKCFSFLMHNLSVEDKLKFLEHTTFFSLCNCEYLNQCPKPGCPKFRMPYSKCWSDYLTVGLHYNIVPEEEFEDLFGKYGLSTDRKGDLRNCYNRMRGLENQLGPISGRCMKSHPEHWDFISGMEPAEYPQLLLDLAYDDSENYLITYFKHHNSYYFDDWELRSSNRKRIEIDNHEILKKQLQERMEGNDMLHKANMKMIREEEDQCRALDAFIEITETKH
uniref:F-box domain-containing protein n=1 Tax=viral metagenome TaxID=1070528 RepID=A0A6C0BMG3_9ZZZZ